MEQSRQGSHFVAATLVEASHLLPNPTMALCRVRLMYLPYCLSKKHGFNFHGSIGFEVDVLFFVFLEPSLGFGAVASPAQEKYKGPIFPPLHKAFMAKW